MLVLQEIEMLYYIGHGWGMRVNLFADDSKSDFVSGPWYTLLGRFFQRIFTMLECAVYKLFLFTAKLLMAVFMRGKQNI